MVIDDRTLNSIVARLRSSLQLRKVILFGSQATGTAKKDSDVDLLIVWATDLPLPKRYNAVNRLLSDFMIPFDLIVKTPGEYARGRRTLNHIVYFAEKYGRVLYEQ